MVVRDHQRARVEPWEGRGGKQEEERKEGEMSKAGSERAKGTRKGGLRMHNF